VDIFVAIRSLCTLRFNYDSHKVNGSPALDRDPNQSQAYVIELLPVARTPG
jgi:hypothetical protein